MRNSRYPIIEDLKDLLKRGLRGVPMTAPVIPRTGGWTGDNQLGNIAKYGPDKRGRQTILKMDEWGPPEIWTVSLYIEQALSDFDGFSVQAEIAFGVGGGTQIVNVDWANGCQISLPMNAINVQAIFSNVDINTEGAGLSLGVQIARGARGGQDLPRLTLEEGVAPGSPGSVFSGEIPPFAKRIVLVPDGTDLAEFYSTATSLRLLSGTGSGTPIVTAYCEGSHPINNVISVPVTGSARYYEAQHSGAGTSPKCTLYAEIDG